MKLTNTWKVDKMKTSIGTHTHNTHTLLRVGISTVNTSLNAADPMKE